MPDPILKITDLESSEVSVNNVNANMFTQDISLDETVVYQNLVLKGGWNLVGIYIDAVKSYADSVGTFANGAGWPEALSQYASDVIIVKDYLGAAYLPEWNFNGVGNITNGQGYQIKMAGSSSVTYTLNLSGRPITTILPSPFGPSFPNFEKYGIESFYLPTGWSMFTIPFEMDSGGIPAAGSFDVHAVISAVFFDLMQLMGTTQIGDIVIIIKDNLGNAYLPEWGFNGIGDFIQGQGYQIKLTQAAVINLSGNVVG
tara:strand:- start:4384 stop:5154 length:771 start_codon:yes stop_codon:yes gene_type:complete